MLDSRAMLKDGHRILPRDYIMAPTTILICRIRVDTIDRGSRQEFEGYSASETPL